MDIGTNDKRIVKNTIYLYIRSIIIMIVNIYASRIVLNALGIEDYGVYNVVGGVVGMFSAVTGALSISISRFLTFELGKGGKEKINRVFCTSINILIAISIAIFILGEAGGWWFIHEKLNIPENRINAACWVLQASLLAFCVNLLSVPYNALIIAHERMSAFAYISLVEAVLKLFICYCIIVSSFDRLILYSVLTAIVAIIIRLVYSNYCRRHFEESKYRRVRDKLLVKELCKFTGWGFLTHCIYIFNTQGVNILINLFFGVVLNAARGISAMVQGIITQFVMNFTMALNPQITKCYAQGNKTEMYTLICRGSKFGYFLLLILSLPVMFETDFILKLWLGVVPEHTANFVRLTIIGAMVDRMGDTLSTANRATGDIKKYSITLSTFTCLIFPLTWFSLYMGCPPESAYVIFILIYAIVQYKRLVLIKEILDFPIMLYVRTFFYKAIVSTIVAVIVPALIVLVMPPSIIRLFLSAIIGVIWVVACIYLFGLTKSEAKAIYGMVLSKLKRI